MIDRPILLLHGALGSKDQLAPLAKKLKNEFTSVHTLTFSGHGGKSLNQEQEFNIEAFTTDILLYLEHQNIKQTDIFGFSMGGYVALNLALKHPEKVGKIFTLGTKLQWSPEIATKEVKMLNAEKIEEKVPAFAKALEQRHAPLNWKEVLKNTADMMIGLGHGAAIETDQFKEIKHPVIIGIGSEDNMVSIAESETVAGLLPNGQMRLYKGLKHPIEEIDVEVFHQEILGFVKN